MPESKQQMAAYIIKDAVDDFQDVIDGVRELSKMFNDPKLVQMVSDLQRMSYYVEQRKSFLDKIKNEKPFGYAIYYFKGIDYYPASSRYDVQDVYDNPDMPLQIASTLARSYPDTEFGVYPVNHNHEIMAKAIRKFNVLRG